MDQRTFYPRRNMVLRQVFLGPEPSGAYLYEARLHINFTDGKDISEGG